jgi:hypothetical protein
MGLLYSYHVLDCLSPGSHFLIFPSVLTPLETPLMSFWESFQSDQTKSGLGKPQPAGQIHGRVYITHALKMVFIILKAC